MAQYVCEHLGEKGEKTRLTKMAKRFCDSNLGVLDNLVDMEEARKLLLSREGEFVHLGARHATKAPDSAAGRLCILDLAINLTNKEFVAHRYCQLIMDEMWLGRCVLII